MELFAPLMRSLSQLDYTAPTPVQALTIPPAMEGRDILASAETGTGKTAAFALPILDYLGHQRPPLSPRCTSTLVLAPTRELAIQIARSFQTYGRFVKFRLALVHGGVAREPQVKALKQGVDVLVATPGRLLDLMEQRDLKLDRVQILVLDEADRMMDMGFLPDLRRIIARLPEQRQSLFFSATLPAPILELSGRLLDRPLKVNVSPREADVGRISQQIQMVRKEEKFSTLCSLVMEQAVERTIVFSRTKRGANRIARKLEQAGIRTMAIHGNKSQNARQKALESFRKNRVAVLVATDVAARGIDIAGVSHVINYDMPHDPESYIHRIGRTGRAGAAGIAISLCTPEERGELRAIERLVGRKISVAPGRTGHRSHRGTNSLGRPGGRRPKRSRAPGRHRKIAS